MKHPHRLLAACLIALAALGLLPLRAAAFAYQEVTPVWQAAEDVRDGLFDAQLELYAAENADDSAAHYQAAAGIVAEAAALYETTLAPTLRDTAPDIHTQINDAFAAASDAAAAGDGPALAAARAHVWTGLLHGAYDVTLAAIAAGDVETADAWARLREFRASTRVNTVDNAAAAAITTLGEGQLSPEAAAAIVGDDLRDTYFFQLREALGQLEAAAAKEYPSRAAEWAAQTEGYYQILRDDFTAKLGEDAAAAFDGRLAKLNTAVLAADWPAVDLALTDVETLAGEYRPVELSAEDIQQKGQLLYIFTDLVAVEYRDGVRNGRISIETEYREAITFRDQAELVYHELQPTIAAADPDQAAHLLEHYQGMETVMVNFGEYDLVQSQVDDAKGIIESTLGAAATATSDAGTFTAVDALLDDLLAQAAAGDYVQAERLRIQAYALFDFGPELHLLGTAPRLAAEAEGLMWHGYNGHEGLAQAIARHASPEEMEAVIVTLRETLDESEQVLGQGSTSPLAVTFNAAAIVFREGLEAVVILAALLASMASERYRPYRRPLVAGSGLALIATALTWIAARELLQSFSAWGERLEAVVSLIAIGVLLLITNWFFHKIYWKDWMAHFHQMKGKLLRADVGQIIGLMVLGFSSMYREGFETVLFLQALVLDAGNAVVVEGIAIGLVGVAIIGYLTFTLQRKMPYMKMLIATGVLIGMVLITMVGGTARTLQAVGWLPISPIYGFRPPYWMGLWFGVYPTWQGVITQFAAGTFVLGSYYIAEMQKKRQREKRAQATEGGQPQQVQSPAR